MERGRIEKNAAFTRKYDSKKIKEQAEMSILKELASIQEEKRRCTKRNWNTLNRR